MDTTLQVANLQALAQRASGFDPAERVNYLGASEVGRCLRQIVWQRLNPDANTRDGKALTSMMRGRVFENEAIQILRLEGRILRQTGNRQTLVQLGFLGAHCDAWDADPDGIPHALEVKCPGQWGFKAWKENGLPVYIVDQAIAQAGLTHSPYTEVVVFNADDMSQRFTVEVPANAERFEELMDRAASVMACLHANELDGSTTNNFPGEPERGYCDGCPISASCLERKGGATTIAAGSTVTGQDITWLLDMEVAMEELATAEKEAAICEAYQERLDAAKAKVKGLLLASMEARGTDSAEYSNASGKVTLARTSRSSIDSKRLKAEKPEVFKDYTTTATTDTLRVAMKKEA